MNFLRLLGICLVLSGLAWSPETQASILDKKKTYSKPDKPDKSKILKKTQVVRPPPPPRPPVIVTAPGKTAKPEDINPLFTREEKLEEKAKKKSENSAPNE